MVYLKWNEQNFGKEARVNINVLIEIFSKNFNFFFNLKILTLKVTFHTSFTFQIHNKKKTVLKKFFNEHIS